uniref:Uncharacterized protein n=1 Tax=Arundo donax TaxID=35708 RepID=A0A0A9EKG5_ARUDO
MKPHQHKLLTAQICTTLLGSSPRRINGLPPG